MCDDAVSRWLIGAADVEVEFRARVARAYEDLATRDTPVDYHAWVSEQFGLDLSSEYGGQPIGNPWGKASGQLSMTPQQVADDAAAGLGYVVLKTVIAESEEGTQSMSDWAIHEARMQVEPITSLRGVSGWTVSWKGRGWWGTLDEYLELIRAARLVTDGTATRIVPSVKYHLPSGGETEWLESEYRYTTRRLLAAWEEAGPVGPMQIEKDFSPTLAGSDRSNVRETVVNWLRCVPGLVRGAAESGKIEVGLKLFNALFDDAFQLEMLRATQGGTGDDTADWLVYGNRLFDPDRQFESHRGIAYGGGDLSDRNLRVLGMFLDETGEAMPSVAATGDICSGRVALEYALRGATSFQLHTFFQLPSEQYVLRNGSRTQKALHELYLHPEDGLVVWLRHLAGRFGMSTSPIRLRDLVGLGRPG